MWEIIDNISPLVDIAFKKVFGTDENNDLNNDLLSNLCFHSALSNDD
jgi:hypothetical protein